MSYGYERVRQIVVSLPLVGMVAWVSLNLLDYLLTSYSLGSGVGGEGNPILFWVSSGNLLGYKLLVPICIVFILFAIKKIKLLRYLNIGMGIIVAWNLFVVGTSWVLESL